MPNYMFQLTVCFNLMASGDTPLKAFETLKADLLSRGQYFR